jgi:hypothetical protein
MAIQIEFTGFVQDVKVFNWGNVAKVTHNQVRKDANGNWENIGYDNFDVILPDGVTVAKNDKITVRGRFKSKKYNKNDGSFGLSLEVKAQEIIPVASLKAGVISPVGVDPNLPF